MRPKLNKYYYLALGFLSLLDRICYRDLALKFVSTKKGSQLDEIRIKKMVDQKSVNSMMYFFIGSRTQLEVSSKLELPRGFKETYHGYTINGFFRTRQSLFYSFQIVKRR